MFMSHLDNTSLMITSDGQPYLTHYGNITPLQTPEAIAIIQKEADVTVNWLIKELEGERSIGLLFNRLCSSYDRIRALEQLERKVRNYASFERQLSEESDGSV